MNYHDICNTSITTVPPGGTETAYHYGTPEFSPVFSGIRVAQSFGFCVVFCEPIVYYEKKA